MAVLLACSEWSFSRVRGPERDFVSFAWESCDRAVRAESRGKAILAFGDSLMKHGFIPSVVEKGTGRTAYNLSSAASPTPATSTFLRRALDNGARPSAILVEMKPSLLLGHADQWTRQWDERLTLAELLGLIGVTRNPTFGLSLLLGKLVPTYRDRLLIREELVARLTTPDAPRPDPFSAERRNWSVNKGANVAPVNPRFVGEVTEAMHVDLLSKWFKVHSTNAVYARRIVKTAAINGVRAYLVIPPWTPELRDRRAATGVEAQYTAFIRTLQEVEPSLTVLDARDSDYPASAFFDPIHLNRFGAIALSRSLAEVLRDDLDRPASRPTKRWVRLSTYETVADPTGAGLEDVHESRKRLSDAGSS